MIAFIKRIRGEPSEAVRLLEQMKKFSRQHSLASKSHLEVQMQDGKDKDNNEPVHLLELVRRQFIDPKAFGIGCVITSSWYSRCSAKNFKSVGIHLKPSKTHQFTDIEFKSRCTSGILTLPRIIIDDTTKSMLLNLAAFEACPDNTNDLGVTSYICFMESIVDQDEDVKELQSNGILINSIGRDKYVVDLFKDISTGLAPSASIDAYLLVKTSIAIYLVKAKWTPIQIATWVKNVMRFAVLYTVVDILLSFIQTYFTVFPSPDKH